MASQQPSAPPTAGIPRYRAIAAELMRRIADYPPGTLLPSEAELAVEFGVTRMTLRQALSGLASSGLIERKHGHGTVVLPRRVARQADVPLSLAEELLASGSTSRSHVLSCEEIRASGEERQSLRLGPRARVIRLRRVRSADGLVIGLQETLVPRRHAPDLTTLVLEDRSLSHLLRERYGLFATRAHLVIEAVAADADVAGALEIEEGIPILRSTRISYLEDQRPLERTTGWFLGHRYVYEFDQPLAPAPTHFRVSHDSSAHDR